MSRLDQLSLLIHLCFGYLTIGFVSGHHGRADDHPEELWKSKYGDQVDLPFTGKFDFKSCLQSQSLTFSSTEGPLSFSHLPYAKCLDEPAVTFDIAILGEYPNGTGHRNHWVSSNPD